MKIILTLVVFICAVLFTNAHLSKDLGSLKSQDQGIDVCKYEETIIGPGKTIFNETDFCRKVKCTREFIGTLIT